MGGNMKSNFTLFRILSTMQCKTNKQITRIVKTQDLFKLKSKNVTYMTT